MDLSGSGSAVWVDWLRAGTQEGDGVLQMKEPTYNWTLLEALTLCSAEVLLEEGHGKIGYIGC